MAFHGLFLEFAEIGDLQFCGRRKLHVRWNANGGEDETEWLVGRIRNAVANRGWQIREIIWGEGVGLLGVMKQSIAAEDEVQLFLSGIFDGVAIAIWRDGQLSETRNADGYFGIGVGFAKDGSVPAGLAGHIDGAWRDRGDLTSEPGGGDFTFLSWGGDGEREKKQQDWRVEDSRGGEERSLAARTPLGMTAFFLC